MIWLIQLLLQWRISLRTRFWSFLLFTLSLDNLTHLQLQCLLWEVRGELPVTKSEDLFGEFGCRGECFLPLCSLASCKIRSILLSGGNSFKHLKPANIPSFPVLSFFWSLLKAKWQVSYSFSLCFIQNNTPLAYPLFKLCFCFSISCPSPSILWA